MVEFLCATALFVGIEMGACGLESNVRIEHVIDGDTVEVSTPSGTRVRVRMLGIDAPEIRGRCASETERAQEASLRLAALLPVGAPAVLKSEAKGWTHDRYGRTLAKISHAGRDAGKQLVSEGLVRRWSPRYPRIDWCGGK